MGNKKVGRFKVVALLTSFFMLFQISGVEASALTSKDKSFLNKVNSDSRADLESLLFEVAGSKSDAYRYLGMVDKFIGSSGVKNEMVKLGKAVCTKISSKSSSSKSQTETYAINYINSVIEILPEAADEEEYVDMLAYISVSYYAVKYAASKYGYCSNQSSKMKSVLVNFEEVVQEKMEEVMASNTSTEEVDPSIDDTVVIE